MRHAFDLSLYLVLDPVLCGGFDGMVATALLTVLYAPFFYTVFMGLSSKLGGKRTPEPKQA